MNRTTPRVATLTIALCVSVLLAGCADRQQELPAAFAQCLTDNGAVMYGTSWCGHCQNQKAMFGASFASITYVDCEDDPKRCDAAGVRGFPTWIIGNVSYPGEKPAAELARLTGCTI